MPAKSLFYKIALCICFTKQLPLQASPIDSLKTALKSYDENNADTNTIRLLYQLSMEYTWAGDYLEAMDVATHELSLSKKIHFQQGIYRGYKLTGIIYSYKGNDPEAIKYYFLALKVAEKNGYTNGMGACYNNIGNVYFSQNNYTEALRYNLMALHLYKKQGNPQDIASSYNNIGNIYCRLSHYKEALDYHSSALLLRKEAGDKTGMGSSYHNMAAIYDEQGKYKEALKHYLLALKLREEVSDEEGITTSYLAIGITNIHLKNTALAAYYLEKALARSKHMGNIERIKESYDFLYVLDSTIGNYKKALHDYRSFINYRDSLINADATAKMQQTEMQYAFDKKTVTDSIKNVNEKKVLASELKQEKTQRYTLYVFLGLILLFLCILANRFSITRKQKALIEKSLEENKLLIGEIHHRVKNNLQIINSMLELQSLSIKDDVAKKVLEESQQRVMTMATIHKKLYRQNNVLSVEIAAYIKDLITNLVSSLASQPIKLTIDAEELFINIDTSISVGLIINELITNSIKHAYAGIAEPELNVVFKLNDNSTYKLVIADNGVGLTDTFETISKTSFGFKIVKSLTKQIHASLQTQHQNGFECVFIIPK